jgi:hypothetical protein
MYYVQMSIIPDGPVYWIAGYRWTSIKTYARGYDSKLLAEAQARVLGAGFKVVS